MATLLQDGIYPKLETILVWHTLPVAEAVSHLQTDTNQGLPEAEVLQRLKHYGHNSLHSAPRRTLLALFFAQFQSLIVLLLVAATGVAFAMGETVEAIAILVVIVLNAVIGLLTEWRADQALTALQKQAVVLAHVIRGGKEREVPAVELVPGDVVMIAAGARVPADGRLAEAARLLIDESTLTGESLPVSKAVETINESNTPLGDRTNMAFMGTTIIDGRGKLIVVATAAQTEMGKIGVLIDETATLETPLERQLAELGQSLVGIVLTLCAAIIIAGSLRGNPFLYMLEVGISLAIAAVPEGLPAVATMTLALGMQRMARMRALVRRLPAVETLGSTTVICTDKTGTLTKNEMTVRACVLDGRHIEITGTGYSLQGEFREHGHVIDPKADVQLNLLLRIGALCNDAAIDSHEGHEVVLGDPTEGALVVLAIKAGLSPAALECDYSRLDEIPFDSQAKRMVTVHRTPDGGSIAFLKGAASSVLGRCNYQLNAAGRQPLTDEDRNRAIETNRQLAAGALRILAFAYREVPENYCDEDLDRDYVFVGLVGMIDPLRVEAKNAIKTCREAGIRTVMITGDQPATAAEIAHQLGLDHDAHGHAFKTIHARELEGLDDAGWERVATETAVFARVSPEHKLRIVEALQRQGQVVAMTGDGVNDAPALKAADIGIAMGIKGTEVAKETADMIITDDNFATIVSAVIEGRIIYANIVKFIHYLFSCNLAEILVVFGAIMLGWPLPLMALQILWLNMVTDVFPAMALALEPSAPNIMQHPPRHPGRKILTLRFVGLIAWQGLLLALVTLVAFRIGLQRHGSEGQGLHSASTMAFMTLALSQVAHAFNARSRQRSAFTSRLFTNKWLWGAVIICISLQAAAVTIPLLQRVLRTALPSFSDWVVIVVCSISPIAIVEVVKVIENRPRPKASK